jgi:hypothetical protein
MLAVVRETEGKIENRKRLNRKVLEFTTQWIKIYEKAYYFTLKELMLNFEKIKKRLAEVFGGRLCSFLKSIHSIFELSVGINEKLLKRTNLKLRSIETHIAEEEKILNLFQREFKAAIDKTLKKKDLQRILADKEGS